jgi:glycosyltransferase involved in cell wall biosynthesis
MTATPEVSVIVSFLNAGRFLEECLESVLAQTCENWELALVDDGSTDHSTKIARDYAARHDRIRYLEHPNHENRGACAGRNLGIRNTSAPYIAILDADDVWRPEKLKEQVRILNANSTAAMVFGRSCYWNTWAPGAAAAEQDHIPELGVEPGRVLNPPRPLELFRPLGTASAPSPSDLLLRRTAVEAVNGFEEEFRGIYQLYEDQAFLAKIYLRFPVVPWDACWTHYRVHPDSCCSTVRAAGKRDEVRHYFLRWLDQHLNGTPSPRVHKLVKQALRPYRWPWLARLQGTVSTVTRVIATRRQQG